MVSDNVLFGKVALLINSTEEQLFYLEIVKILQQKNIIFELIDINSKVANLLDKSMWHSFSRAFIALTNTRESFGYIQALLDFFTVPYTGCSMAAMALALDRIKTKKLLQVHGIATTPFLRANILSIVDLQETISLLGFPVAVKSINALDHRVYQARSIDQLAAIGAKFTNVNELIIEPWVTGDEYLVYLIQQQALLPLPLNFIDPDNQVMVKLSCLTISNIQQLALDASVALDCSSGICAVKIIKDLNNDCWVLSVIPNPSFAINSCFNLAAKNSGISFDSLIEKILFTSFVSRINYPITSSNQSYGGYTIA